MAALTIVYDANVPDHCPPAGAEDRDVTLFRVCKTNPPKSEDYVSHINSKDKNKNAIAARKLKIDPKDCDPSGISVWITEKSMRHACKVFRFTQGRFVFKTDVVAGEGMLMLTGEEEHHTYWPKNFVNLYARAYFGFGPVDRANVDVD
ncbi:hypothetical protein [Sphingomonas sp. CFBP9019]|uniref:hypothetical protein n=1 Tax=Sphingomonas sp. CFBP9019 TaxID=3096532 RepID=UPI002A6A7C43|nr:hypothetical protein [Sphingomonas sp. CFBP9019]MDY1010337.1 hypothetical protein [Sphingomonas sp. CFBP9019]